MSSSRSKKQLDIMKVVYFIINNSLSAQQIQRGYQISNKQIKNMTTPQVTGEFCTAYSPQRHTQQKSMNTVELLTNKWKLFQQHKGININNICVKCNFRNGISPVLDPLMLAALTTTWKWHKQFINPAKKEEQHELYRISLFFPIQYCLLFFLRCIMHPLWVIYFPVIYYTEMMLKLHIL